MPRIPSSRHSRKGRMVPLNILAAQRPTRHVKTTRAPELAEVEPARRHRRDYRLPFLLLARFCYWLADRIDGTNSMTDARQAAEAIRATRCATRTMPRCTELARTVHKDGVHRFYRLSSVLARMRFRGTSRKHRSPSRRQRTSRAGPSDSDGSKPPDS